MPWTMRARPCRPSISKSCALGSATCWRWRKCGQKPRFGKSKKAHNDELFANMFIRKNSRLPVITGMEFKKEKPEVALQDAEQHGMSAFEVGMKNFILSFK